MSAETETTDKRLIHKNNHKTSEKLPKKYFLIFNPQRTLKFVNGGENKKSSLVSQ